MQEWSVRLEEFAYPCFEGHSSPKKYSVKYPQDSKIWDLIIE